MESTIICVFDTETTGLSKDRDRIISIAASCRGAEFSSFVRPKIRIPPRATQINGITEADVAQAPDWSVVGPSFWQWIEERRIEAGASKVALVAYNASFDMKMIQAEMARIRSPCVKPPKLECIDVLKVARSRIRILNKYRQCDVYEHLFHEQPGNQHNALGDVRALVRICEHPEFANSLALFTSPIHIPFPTALFGPVKHAQQPALAGPVTQPASVHTESNTPASARRCEACGAVYSEFFKHACVQLS